MGNAKVGGYGGGEAATALRPDLFLFYLVLLSAVTQGKEVVLGKAGGTVDLPCQASQNKIMAFNWKRSSEKIKILALHMNSFVSSLVTGRMAQLLIGGGKLHDLNILGVRVWLLVSSDPRGLGLTETQVHSLSSEFPYAHLQVAEGMGFGALLSVQNFNMHGLILMDIRKLSYKTYNFMNSIATDP